MDRNIVLIRKLIKNVKFPWANLYSNAAENELLMTPDCLNKIVSLLYGNRCDGIKITI